jgi:hypothetical protein
MSIKSLLLILCVFVTVFLSDISVEKFLIKKEFIKNEEIAKSITNNIINTEIQMEKILTNGLTILENDYLKNPNPTKEQVQVLINKAGVDSLFIYNSNGKPTFSSTGSLENPKFKDYYANFPLLFERDEYFADVMIKEREIISLPIIIPIKGWNHPFKLAILWNKKLNIFLEAKIRNSGIKKILLDNINVHSDVLSLKIQVPSGYILAEVNQNDRIEDATVKTAKSELVKKYITSTIIENKNVSMFLKFSFGDKGINKHAASHGLTNADERYFYTAIIEFSKTTLNKHLLFIRITFFLITVLILIIICFIRKFINYKDSLRFALKQQAFQIHHDIASPLQALDWRINAMTKERMVMVGQDAIDLKYSVEAIRDVLVDMHYLHDNSKTKELKISTELVYPIIYSAFCSARLLLGYDEKNREKLSIEQTKDFNLLLDTDRVELRRVILNLIKNAIESKGDVKISLKKQDNSAIITIKDTGCGIPEDTLKRLMSGKSVTEGKASGRGLGFSYAKRTIEKLQGTITLQSALNKGTEQIITFPISKEKPSWFVEKINLEGIKTAVIVDDFEGIHKIWQDKLKDRNIKLVNCFNAKEFEDYLQQQNANTLKETFFFVDYSLQTILDNGITLITKHNLQDRAILVTSKYLESLIKDISVNNNIKIIPKEFVEMIDVVYLRHLKKNLLPNVK